MWSSFLWQLILFIIYSFIQSPDNYLFQFQINEKTDWIINDFLPFSI